MFTSVLPQSPFPFLSHSDIYFCRLSSCPPVRFAMDRAGMVGADGATHVGAFDVTFMASLPHMVTMAPSNEAELINMVATAVAIDDRPSCFRCVFRGS